MKHIFYLPLVILMLSCAGKSGSTENKEAVPQNIIFLIGDGMGLSAVSIGYYYQEEESQFSRFKHIGLIKTSSATHKITDSAAAGTALACGKKTRNGVIGLDTVGAVQENLVEFVSDRGWSTGFAVSSSVTHATPASYYAHVPSRNNYEEIAEQLLNSEIDFFAGGGKNHFNQRKDQRDLFAETVEKNIVIDTLSLSAPASFEEARKYGFVLSPDHLPKTTEGRGDILPRATSLALEYLSQDEDGFFLMVEGSRIDHAGHANDVDYSIGEQLDFEEAIKIALDFADKDKKTLVVVTADHETGGFALSSITDPESGKRDYRYLDPGYVYGGHTATLVPVFAYGPGAESFAGVYDLTKIFWKMKALTGLE